MMKILSVIIIGLALATLGTAYGQTWNSDDGSNAIWSWTTSNIYQIHQVHVGDKVYVTNDDKNIHSIRGQDTSGEIFQSSAIYPGGQFEMSFMFPGNFTFYDEYNRTNFGLIEIYNPGDGFPTVTNTTTSRVTYQGTPYYSNLAVGDDSGGGGTTISFSGSSNATQVDFSGSSNATQVVTKSNSTQTIITTLPTLPPGNDTNIIGNETDNNTVAYWKDQATMWHSKYTDLYNNIRALLGI
jgi:hypothetical protein